MNSATEENSMIPDKRVVHTRELALEDRIDYSIIDGVGYGGLLAAGRQMGGLNDGMLNNQRET
jgi:hypothetical protein